MVLLIACANLANLLLARASAREREVALRQAIGASRTRLVAQLMSENLLLAGAGALLGALLAQGLSRALVAFLTTADQPVHVPLGVDWRVFGFLAALALLTCALFGLTPVLRATKTAPADAMRGGRGTLSGSERHGLRRGLVVSQIALSFILLVGALLFGQSLRNLLRTDTGLDSDGVLVATINAKTSNVEPEHRRAIFTQLEERINAFPGVVSAAAVWIVPFIGSGVIRARGSFSGIMKGVQQQMAQLDPGLLVDFRVLNSSIEQSVLPERLMANLSGGFGVLAALLSTLGLYGVMSYMVARRRNEIGVRLAHGAGTGDSLGLILREAGLLVLIGLALGLAGSFGLSRYAESLLFGLKTNDATSLVLGVALLAVTGLAAALLPALRASRLHPADVLQDE